MTLKWFSQRTASAVIQWYETMKDNFSLVKPILCRNEHFVRFGAPRSYWVQHHCDGDGEGGVAEAETPFILLEDTEPSTWFCSCYFKLQNFALGTFYWIYIYFSVQYCCGYWKHLIFFWLCILHFCCLDSPRLLSSALLTEAANESSDKNPLH